MHPMSERIRATFGPVVLASTRPGGSVISAASIADELDRLHAIVSRLPEWANRIESGYGDRNTIIDIYEEMLLAAESARAAKDADNAN